MHIYEIYTIIQGYYTNCIRGVQNCTFSTFFFSCHLRIIRFTTTNSFISCILFNSRITIQILTLIMMFREKNLFLRFISFFKSNPLEIWFTHHMWHIMYAYGWNLHHCIRVILTVQGRCSIGQGKCYNCTRQMF